MPELLELAWILFGEKGFGTWPQVGQDLGFIDLTSKFKALIVNTKEMCKPLEFS